MAKLTHRQDKNRKRVLAWLNNEPFSENRRDSSKVPGLSLEQVITDYVPPDITGAGQFFTPIGMAELVLKFLAPHFKIEGRILDPCAGIGNLLYHLRDLPGCEVTAYEMEEECYRVGRKLYSQFEWVNEVPFEFMESLTGQFDFVICNPPFGTHRGMQPGFELSAGRAQRSEHVFTELCIRSLREGGVAAIIAPHIFWDNTPQSMKNWLSSTATLQMVKPLQGDFEHTSIDVSLFVFRLGLGWPVIEITKPEPKKLEEIPLDDPEAILLSILDNQREFEKGLRELLNMIRSEEPIPEPVKPSLTHKQESLF